MDIHQDNLPTAGIDRLKHNNTVRSQQEDLRAHLELLSAEELALFFESIMDPRTTSEDIQLIADIAREQSIAAHEVGDDSARNKYQAIHEITETYAFWRQGDERGDVDVYYRQISKTTQKTYDDFINSLEQ